MEQKKGSFVLSLDTELAWGSFDKGLTSSQIQSFNDTRQCIVRFLSLLEKYQIRVTFAMVGHLMLAECRMQDGMKHPELIRPNFSWYQKDWFSEDPATNLTIDPIWYGADILNDIRRANPEHEIASHSFSHIIFGDKGCSPECAASDIAECVRIAEQHGLKLTSFVFPRNSEGHKDILKNFGFSIYRGSGNEWYNSIASIKIRKICHYLDELLGITPGTSCLQRDEYGLYNTVGNMLYWSREGIRRYIPISMRVRKAQKGIDRAIQQGEVFHMWFHPFNLTSDPEGLLGGLEQILAYVRQKINAGLMDNYTMQQLCESYASPAVPRNKG